MVAFNDRCTAVVHNESFGRYNYLVVSFKCQDFLNPETAVPLNNDLTIMRTERI